MMNDDTMNSEMNEMAGGNWYSQLPDELRSEPSLQRFQDVGALAKSYVHANRLIGDKLGMPSENSTPEQWGEFYGRLGRPESHDQYQLDFEGDKQFMDTAKGWFHKAGLSQRQAEALAREYHAYASQQAQQQSPMSMRDESGEYELEELKNEWGGRFDQNVALGQRAVRHFAADAGAVDKLEDALGTAGVIKLFHRIGMAMSEDSLAGAGSAGGSLFAMGPQDAKAAIQRMMSDSESVAALMNREHPKHRELMEKRSELFRLAYPE